MKKKPTIMQTPEITDEEISQLMDFESVLTKHKSTTSSNAIRQILLWTAGLVSISVATFLYVTFIPTENHPVLKNEPSLTLSKKPGSSVMDSARLTKAETVQAVLATKKALGQHSKSNTIQGSPKEATQDVYAEAEPVVGYPELYNYFNTNLHYPTEAEKDSIEGVVTVTFIITPTGETTKLAIANSLGIPFDKEVTRLIENMPKWNPAALNGRSVASKISIPLTFKFRK
jgi:TonB family protein